ncbi:SusD/RagB family nutrient-binding outer membrane lipoprotein [Pontibacter silvestris]|uniref:SusD/RagB family nutrient-binding outer membrane lipoprotein n=1 Tax=Pontibacter silvestris TaxID=2305183 RepID=UPI001E4E46FE|nr:SusD/RagB family nutrient-binding outer membrane lipoprotein [Pontibacter silvestris]MCC9136384.1 SusD/RagB family nutrient-binding outer membrane lipoprotein [Pontibacter silvestris]
MSELNVNPNLPSEASGTQLIANAELSLPSLSASPTGEFLAQYLAETQYVTASLYPAGGTSFYWLYQGPLMNLQTVLINAENLDGNEGPVANQLAVAKILQAYYMWHITDRWGDVPYTEALQGADNFTPAYDTQEYIYNNLFTLLDEANEQIVSGNISNDIIYGGDMAKWKKLGNTIHLLMALRLSEVDPVKGQEEFNKALAAGIMTSNDDNLVFHHLANANNQSYWYSQWVTQNREWWALTETLVGEMKPVADPRLEVYGQPARKTGEYIGLNFGETVNMNTEDYSLLGTAIYAQDAPVYLVTYAQALFAQAEAAKRGWITGGDAEAEAYYNEAVKQSVMQWTGSNEGAEELLSQPGIAYNPANAIEQIATQRWIHLFMHGYEAWAEWRRTGYPDNLVTPGGKAVPRRQMYDALEASLNAANYNAALQRQFNGEDGLYGRVWWDQ